MKDLEFMQRALALAKRGEYHVAPNPMVGCVITHGSTIVAEGYHVQYGGAHAEVEAVQRLPDSLPPSECTVYVTLEPCSHFGKTPPCANLLIEKGFKKVVVACKDPNPMVAGKGIERLTRAGIQVIIGLLEKEAKWLNRRFFYFHKQHKPYVTLKWAQSRDGFISRLPVPTQREENRVSGNEASLFTQQLRASHMAILVGKTTALADNPLLTNRSGEGKNPIRVLIDPQLEVPEHYQLFTPPEQVLVFNHLREETHGHIRYLKLERHRSVEYMLLKMKDLGIQSLLVEGGTITLQQFMDAGAWQEGHVIVNPGLEWHDGVKAPQFDLQGSPQALGKDLVYHFLGHT